MPVDRAELALAAARTRILGEQLGDRDRDELIASWAEMLDELENPRTSSTLTLADYRARIEQRLEALRTPA